MVGCDSKHRIFAGWWSVRDIASVGVVVVLTLGLHSERGWSQQPGRGQVPTAGLNFITNWKFMLRLAPTTPGARRGSRPGR